MVLRESTNMDSLATFPCDWDNVSLLVHEISSHASSLSSNCPQQRINLLKAARSLTFAVQTPMERILWHSWAEPTLFVTLDTVIQLGIFSLLKEAKNMEMDIGQLSKKSGSDPALLSRFMKRLASMEVVLETDVDRYQLTNMSLVLSAPKYASAFPFLRKGIIPAMFRLPEYLAKSDYINPTDPLNGPFQYATGASENWFAWVRMQQNGVFENFNNHMSAYNEGNYGFMDPEFYPIEEQLFKDIPATADSAELVTLVDVGGGIGHDIARLLSRFPEAPGRFVLQDLPNVIKQAREASLNKRIEFMEHNFFTEQSVKGARAYYMHSVLHDWTNEKALEILRCLKVAMTPGYNRVLIHENAISHVNADWQSTALDIMMMTILSSKERRESEWRQTIEEAGLKVLKIWRSSNIASSNNAESLIECELAES
ncbi:hypothetical protein OIDMADRAFT_37940 [Oidiodendron maius Zn]|uniref:Uncharacterized protein n=1 Tax=Oidiodendron maius (strain Zn) TaxID=913774 RepID=A0A0C3HL88_OIDMZ|nr:hypothetical protein OIDMADRAFT_37940 [Oidiodendron maius Zn]